VLTNVLTLPYIIQEDVSFHAEFIPCCLSKRLLGFFFNVMVVFLICFGLIYWLSVEFNFC